MASLLDSTPPPARMAREDVAASQRWRMLRAMAEAVAEKGDANTVVADVTARARVSRKTFYEQFSGKEACFLATFDASVAAVRTGVAASLEDLGASAPLRDQIRRMLAAYLELLAAEPAIAKANLVEVYAAGPEAARRRRASLDAFAALLEDAHARLHAAGIAGPVVADAVYEHVVGAISSAVTIRVATGDAARLPELADELADFVVRALEG
jgi:AcrR family transcriptional regulator